MKAILLGLLTFAAVSSAQASCGELIDLKNVLVQEMSYLRAQISTSTNTDQRDLYMDQYDRVLERYLSVSETLQKDCVSNND